MKRVGGILEQQPRVDPGDREARGRERRERHVQGLRRGGRVSHGRERIHIDRLAVRERESRRRVHPRVRDHDEDAGRHAARGHGHACPEVRAPRDTIPAVQVDAQEDRFGEEREPLEGERHADDRPGELHEARPQEAQLERQHRSRDGTDREQDGGPLRPQLGEVEIDRVSGHLPAPLRHDHEDRHGDPDDGKHDMERERDAHLGAGRQQVGHGLETNGVVSGAWWHPRAAVSPDPPATTYHSPRCYLILAIRS